MNKKKGIAILGSTGSVGRQALEVISAHPEHFFVSLLCANSQSDLLIQQAMQFRPDAVVIIDETQYKKVSDALFIHDIKVYAGAASMLQLIPHSENYMVLNAISGFAGLKATLACIEAKKPLALANKESLVVAGDYIQTLNQKYQTPVIPVDSEHSALFQCLSGEGNNPIRKIYLTASGGPFAGKQAGDLNQVRIEEALAHPTWKMGNKISIDSATLINKGFERIAAHWLFNVPAEDIEILLHPQSIIHSLIEFNDGNIKALMSPADMHFPIRYAFTYPERLDNQSERLSFDKSVSLQLSKLESSNYPNLELANQALAKGGNLPCVLNAGNEIAVHAFLENRIGFNDIARINEVCLEKAVYVTKPTINDYYLSDKETREIAKKIIS